MFYIARCYITTKATEYRRKQGSIFAGPHSVACAGMFEEGHQ